MHQRIDDLQYCCFMVNKRRLCLWDYDILKRNSDFLDSIDLSYFQYLSNVYASTLSSSEEDTARNIQHAALATRAAYSQALETLFALLFASIQAPYCIPAWLNAYQSDDLHKLVEYVQQGKPFPSVLSAESPTWFDIYDSIVPKFGMEKGVGIRKNFAEAWSYFADDFIDNSFKSEYNSIKHGLRLGLGGHQTCMNGVEFPSSPFGSTYPKLKKVCDSKSIKHISLKEERRNWKLEGIATAFQVLATSLKNLQNILRAKSKIGSSEVAVVFEAPDPSDFEGWENRFGIVELPESEILPGHIQPFSEEIESMCKSGKYYGSRHELGSEDEKDMP